MPAQPVDATPSSLLTRQYLLHGTDLLGPSQLEPKQGFVLFTSMPLGEFSFVDARGMDFEQVLHRPLETTEFIEHWRSDFTHD